jgi:hypothetical protein
MTTEARTLEGRLIGRGVLMIASHPGDPSPNIRIDEVRLQTTDHGIEFGAVWRRDGEARQERCVYTWADLEAIRASHADGLQQGVAGVGENG